MKTILLMVCLMSCATTSLNYGEPENECPRPLTEDQQRSGYFQCRAECASWGRNIVEYDKDCRCVCDKPMKAAPSPYTPKKATPGKTPNTQI